MKPPDLEDDERLTVSIGVTAVRAENTVESLIGRVDDLLYAAKAAGRNCVRGG